MKNKFCPSCGNRTLRHIEDTEPDSGGEYKEVLTCDHPGCDTLVYIIQRTDPPEQPLPEGMIDYDHEDRLAYESEKLERRRPSEY